MKRSYSIFIENENNKQQMIEKANNSTFKFNINKNIPFKKYRKLNWKWFHETGYEENFMILGSNLVIHPIRSFGTSAIKFDSPLKLNALTYWEITIPELLSGTSIMVGIGLQKSKRNSTAFLNLIGIDELSFGLSHKG